ncbi:MAG: ribonuclease R [Flammeovirgaceae bacterium]|nr:ribonuclease R [Flammeovirgaceae bacterium]
MSKKKKSSSTHGKIPRVKINIKQKLRLHFQNRPNESFSFSQVVKHLKIREGKSKEFIKELLFKMEAERQLHRGPDGRWITALEPTYYEGTVDHVNPKFAYIMVASLTDDIWVKSKDLNFAIHGDIVNIQITRSAKASQRPEGRVISIVKRAKNEFVGRLEVSQKFGFVVLNSRNIYFDVMVYPQKFKKATHNDKVLVKIDKWPNKENNSPLGSITHVLGKAGENNTEIHAIMAEYDLPFKFSKKIEGAADFIPSVISKEEINKRRDFRKEITFTIDPHDAKDFDDALSIKKLKNGNIEVGIHIADVSYYVTPNSLLDKEAFERATSVYLVDRTIPMLPEKLSNALCSLRPKEEKLTFSAVFEINHQGKVFDKWFGRTVIYSDQRFTYEDAQKIIEGNAGDYQEEILLLNDLAGKIREQRFVNGAVNFESVEVNFRLDEKGKPLEVIPKERKEAHKMIEEFMLLANREVATFIFDRGELKQSENSLPFVYRVHNDPDPEKLDNFSKFASRFGYKLLTYGGISKNLNKLLGDIKGKPEQNVLESIAIRSMAKARYTTDPKRHFGLAFEHYTHFTSPIRRYPDIMVHRLLWDYLEGGKIPEKEIIEQRCMHSSEREKRAAEAERTSIKFKQVEFMSELLGETFEGIVSGVTEWGLFVEISATKCEGMIRIADIDCDQFQYDEKQYRIVGRRTGKIISLGDEIHVKVMKTDIDRRTIDLLWIEK